ncbi:apo protein 3 mitochondrial [Phtheirospermum japonicum]|uniref:Apo protein 3 mitochondrial n=1 Tax=Phtheirospermum japonicum TaxID=374723 RepID=A0A830BEM7_9LAMI|nr:apo protein 3 mitochondrial [Phtheirospermum japonicum]
MFIRRSRTLIHNHRYYLTAAVEVKNRAFALYSTGSGYAELPKKLKRSERKPWVTDINEIKRKSRLENLERSVVREATLKPPENGLLVKELIPVSHDVFTTRARLLSCVSRVSRSVPIFVCSVCGDVHVGDPPHRIRTCNVSGKNKEHTWERGGPDHVFPVVDSFHLYDRLGRAVSHNERLEVDRIPAIVELCIQAGVEIQQYPTKRRYAELGMEALENMRLGVNRLMQKYAVQTCGYCPEVQVGPKGHRVRQCQAFKHQMRDGQHAWQQATFDDLVPPVYVWHVADRQNNPLLVDGLKRYYGMLPALVELFAHGGAQIGENYQGVMREDVVVPTLDEEKLVV